MIVEPILQTVAKAAAILHTTPGQLGIGTAVILSSFFVIFAILPGSAPTIQVKEIPGPSGHPLIGSLFELARCGRNGKRHELVSRWKADYGPIFKVKMLGATIVFVTDPMFVHNLLTDMNTFSRAGSLEIAATGIADNALFVLASGEKWKHHRKNLQKAFSPGQTRLAAKITHDRTLSLIVKLKQAYSNKGHLEVDIHEAFTCLTLDIIGIILFSHNFNAVDNYFSDKENVFSEVLKKTIKILEQRISCPTILWPLFGIGKNSPQVLKIRKYFEELLKEIKQEKRDESDQVDILKLLMDTDAENVQKFTENEVFGEVIGFILAGHETTSNTLAFIALELSRNMGIQAKLKKEIKTVLARVGTASVENISEFKFLDQVIKESQRLHTVATVVVRRSSQAIEHDGYLIPANAKICGSIREIHLDPQFWAEPTVFNPDRWNDGDSIVPNSFLPFGDGPHKCIGQKIAIVEMK
ncbi:hypothetical protein HK100_003825, partial [Physocladia obscura]